MKKGPKMIGVLGFLGENVQIYHDKRMDESECIIMWRARNPETYYQGIVYLIPGKPVKYPDDAVIPEQTAYDREQIPKAIIVGTMALSNKQRIVIKRKLIDGFKKRNGI